MECEERYSFFAEWLDPVSTNLWKFSLFFFPRNETLELFDLKRRRVFLKRTKCDSVTQRDIFVGSCIKIYSRLITITDYADEYTKSKIEIRMQRTFGFIKPDALDKCDQILKTLCENDLQIVNLKLVKIDERKAVALYEDIDKSILPTTIDYIVSRPILAFEAIGDNSVSRLLNLAGPVDPNNANINELQTLRVKFGCDSLKNAIHVAESATSASKQAQLFFKSRKDPQPIFTCENTTCCVIKPHALKEGKLGEILCAIREFGYEITGIHMCSLTIQQAHDFLEIYKGVLSEYEAMVDELSSGPCVALQVTTSTTNDVVTEFRKIIGPFDPEIGKSIRPNTIRARFGKNKIENAVHVTDLPEDAQLEIEFMFKL